MDHSSLPTTPPPEVAPGRRGFFLRLTCGLGAIAAAAVALPVIGYVFQTRKKRAPWVDLGPVSAFPVEQTRMVTFANPIRQPWDGMVANTGVYVRRLENQDKDTKDQFLVFAVNCAHLGCPVSWFPQSGLFMCPCHGGVY